MRRTLRTIGCLVVVFAVGAGPAWASHDGDLHSANMTNIFSSPNATGATNSDLTFWGDRAYAGNYDGFRIFDVSNPAAPVQLVDYRCPGAQVDTAVWRNRLLFVAVDRTMTGPECGASPSVAHDDPNGWEGVRIFDVSNPRAPRYVKSVYTDCGAHTITLYPRNPSQVLLYVSSYPLRPGPTCGPVRGPEAGNSPLHEKISVIRVPVERPDTARVIAEPRISYPGDPDNQFTPSEHNLAGPGLVDGMTACHDIGVFVQLRLAGAACAEQAQLWRIDRNGIPDTEHPIWVYDDETDTDGPGRGDVAVDFWHSATFSWDGKVVNFIDESFGSGCPTVTPITYPGRPTVQSDTGRMFFLDTDSGEKLSHYQITRPPESGDYCSAHLGNVVPTSDRYLLANAWYTGGADVIDFTNPHDPVEVAYYDAQDDPLTVDRDESQDNWSLYSYEGPALREPSLTLYSTQHEGTNPRGIRSAFGFDVFRANITVEEQRLPFLNPQTQMYALGSPSAATVASAARRRASKRPARRVVSQAAASTLRQRALARLAP
jgi:hypothetical protein